MAENTKQKENPGAAKPAEQKKEASANDWSKQFKMPMFKEWFPVKLRPWLYTYFVLCFQMTSGVYLGGLAHIQGDLAILREDVMMGFYASMAGLSLWFPMLLRMKFRFTNRTLLLFSSISLAILNVWGAHVSSVAAIWIICFLCGILKLQGTFECMSNIMKWITPEMKFASFYSFLFFFVMGSISLSDLLAVWLAYYTHWTMMPYFMAIVMLVNALIIFVCTHHFRFMKPMPLYGIDWLGGLLWVFAVMQTAYIFTYGEHHNWFESNVIQSLCITTFVTYVLAVFRMNFIHHPWIEPQVLRAKYLRAVIILGLLIGVFTATNSVLENVFYEAGPEWHEPQTSLLQIPVIVGVATACIFAYIWNIIMEFKKIRLLAVGLVAFLLYAIYFYFTIDQGLNMSKLHLPMFLRGFASTTILLIMIFTIKSLSHPMVVFQAIGAFQWINLVVCSAVGGAFYSFGLRYFMADNTARYGAAMDASGRGYEALHHVGHVMSQLQLASVKQLYGIAIYVVLGILAVVLMLDFCLVQKKVDTK